jgi:uncharacterized SAM-binding protein YcdF (DUF218 family)
MGTSAEELCEDLNRITAWLAEDDCGGGEAPQFDAIVLLGNQVVETLVAACRLALRIRQARLVFSGGIGGATDYLLQNLRDSEHGGMFGDGRLTTSMTEAAVYAVIARDRYAIPEGRLLLEADSSNSGENVRFTLRMLRDAGCASGSVVLIQDPLLLRRAAATWDREREREGLARLERIRSAVFVPRVEPGPQGMPVLVAEQRQGTWSMQRYLGLAMGEMERLHDHENGYGPRGRDYLDHVEIPGDVWESYLRVRESRLGKLGVR